MSAAPGWYPESGRLRWWNGYAWTQDYAPLPTAAAPAPVVIVQQRHQTSHGFHLIMTLLTFGLWGLFVWLPVGIYNSVRR